MTRLVCDSSAVVALLVDRGTDGRWAAEQLIDASLFAPGLVDFEVSNILRRHESAGLITGDTARQAHTDLVGMPVERWPYQLIAARVWALRHNLTSYDASYVAVAELTGATLVTLDRRLSRAPGLRCAVAVPT